MRTVFHLDGRYFGYLRDGKFLYRHDGLYVGWLTAAGDVFLAADGAYLGSMQGQSHVVRTAGAPAPPKAMVKPVPPAGKLMPVRMPNRVATPPQAGVADALTLL